jgi:hypothetical protein
LPLRIGFDDAGVRREAFTAYQPFGYATLKDTLEQISESFAVAKAAVPVLGERRMIRHLVFQAQAAEPAVGQIEMNFLAQASFGPNPEAVTDDQHADHQFWINRGSPDGAVERFHVLPERTQVEKLMNAPEQMVLRNMVFHAEGVEQLLTTCCLTTHHGNASS